MAVAYQIIHFQMWSGNCRWPNRASRLRPNASCKSKTRSGCTWYPPKRSSWLFWTMILVKWLTSKDNFGCGGSQLPPWKLTYALNINGWKMIHFLLKWSLFRGYVNFRWGKGIWKKSRWVDGGFRKPLPGTPGACLWRIPGAVGQLPRPIRVSFVRWQVWMAITTNTHTHTHTINIYINMSSTCHEENFQSWNLLFQDFILGSSCKLSTSG